LHRRYPPHQATLELWASFVKAEKERGLGPRKEMKELKGDQISSYFPLSRSPPYFNKGIPRVA